MDKPINEILDKFFNECPQNIVDRSVEKLKEVLDIETIETIRKEHKTNPDTWWASSHHGWGTAIRNFLRDNVCLDDKLPSGNWDDYYIQCVEIVCGVRDVKKV